MSEYKLVYNLDYAWMHEFFLYTFSVFSPWILETQVLKFLCISLYVVDKLNSFYFSVKHWMRKKFLKFKTSYLSFLLDGFM